MRKRMITLVVSMVLAATLVGYPAGTAWADSASENAESTEEGSSEDGAETGGEGSTEAESTAEETSEETDTEASQETADSSRETTAEETTAKETTAKETTAKETTAKETTAKETTGASKQESSSKTENTKQYVIVLDPGHGGVHVGTAFGGLVERDVNLKLGLYTRDYLSEYSNITVYMTRTTDTQLSTDIVEDLTDRVAVGASVGADFVISLHCNGNNNYSITGTEAYIPVTEPYHSVCKTMADYILTGISSSTGLTNRGTYGVWDTAKNREYYAICRHGVEMGIPSLIIEHAYMSNPSDLALLADDGILHMMALADANGIAAYFGAVKDGSSEATTVPMTPTSGMTTYQASAVSEEQVAEQAAASGQSEAEILAANVAIMTADEVKTVQEEQTQVLSLNLGTDRRGALLSEWNRFNGSNVYGVEALQIIYAGRTEEVMKAIESMPRRKK